MKKVFVLLCLLAIQSFSNTGTLTDAVNAYKKGNYQLAIEKYDSLLQTGVTSPEIYYNLGNSFYKQGKLGYAILNYERGLKLSPSDDDLNFNLKLAHTKIMDRIEPAPQFFLTKWLNAVLHAFSADGWTIIVLLTLTVFAGIGILFFLTTSTSARKMLAVAEIPVVLLFFIFSVFLFIRYQADSHRDYGVVVSPVIGAKPAPDSKETDSFVLHEGVKVKVEETDEQWYKIRLDDGKVGWILKNGIEII
jgi:tetratricopeptide (TPR) repeat protein